MTLYKVLQLLSMFFTLLTLIFLAYHAICTQDRMLEQKPEEQKIIEEIKENKAVIVTKVKSEEKETKKERRKKRQIGIHVPIVEWDMS